MAYLFKTSFGSTGASEQNLLKLFDWLITNNKTRVNLSLPQTKVFELKIIY